MKVMYIAAECKPFSKAGGVGDVAGELPVALKEVGVEVEVVTPLYGSVDRKLISSKSPLRKYIVDYDWKPETVTVHQSMLGDVPVWLLANSTYFDGVYGVPYVNSPYIPYEDDIRRFAFFSKACLELIRWRDPDIVHVNDWAFGYLFGWMRIQNFRQKRVLTVHNVGYQGNIFRDHIRHWPVEEFVTHGLTKGSFEDPRPHWGSVNALRMALELSDMTNTVSPTYCLEMTQPEESTRYFEGGKGLDEVARKLKAEARLLGILNGFEYKANYSEALFGETLEKKKQAKAVLAAYFTNRENLLLGFVGRAVEQKFKLLSEPLDGRPVLEHILAIPGVNVAILATGLAEYEAFIGNIVLRRFDGTLNYESLLQVPRRDNYSCTVAFDRFAAERLSLGSDVFLMPSLFEPCGITQMESMSFATPPLVRSTGGLADTVTPHDQPGGNGFVFDGNTGEEVLRNLITTVRTASELYRNDTNQFKALQQNAMKKRFLWAESAEQYLKNVYCPLMEGRGSQSTDKGQA